MSKSHTPRWRKVGSRFIWFLVRRCQALVNVLTRLALKLWTDDSKRAK